VGILLEEVYGVHRWRIAERYIKLRLGGGLGRRRYIEERSPILLVVAFGDGC